MLLIEHAEGGAQTIGDAIRVRTRTRRHGDEAWSVVQTTDNGPGIPADVPPHVFDPFFTTKPVGQGTGLRLSVSYGIVSPPTRC